MRFRRRVSATRRTVRRQAPSTTTSSSSAPEFGGSVAALASPEKGTTWACSRRVAASPTTSTPPRRGTRGGTSSCRPCGCSASSASTCCATSLVVSGAGVGGGSLVYGNTLYQPGRSFYDDPHWRDVTDWEAELAPYYDQARRMLGVATYDRVTPADQVMQQVADDLGVRDTWRPTDVGVVLGPEPGASVGDPYFGGVGPERNACRHWRRVHDRLPAQRQEHPGQEPPAPGRAGRGDRAPADHRDGGATAPGRRLGRRHPPDGPPAQQAHLHRRARRARGRRPRDPAAAARAARRRHPGRPLAPARRS